MQFHLTSRRSCNCSENVLEYFRSTSRLTWIEARVWVSTIAFARQSKHKKNHTPSDFRPPTRDGGDCCENSPVGLFRLKLLILENILQLWRRECVSIDSEFYLFLTSYDVGKMLSFCCLFQQSIVSSNCQLSLPVVTNDDENAAVGVYMFSTKT